MRRRREADPIPGGVDPADWATLWQSEVAALAVDREAHEALHACPGVVAARERRRALTQRPDAPGPMRRRGPRPLPLLLTPRDEQIEQLRRRIAELEG